MIRGLIYRVVMRAAHRFNWHYAPPIYPEGDTQLWCQWCGFRQTIRKAESRLFGSSSAILNYQSKTGAQSSKDIVTSGN